MRKALKRCLILILFLSSAACAQDRADVKAPPERAVVINGTQLDDAQVRALEQHYRTRIQDGDYWYDAVSGAWGIAGEATQGFVQPGLDLPGPLRPDASNGVTGVFVNRRELPDQDVAALQQIAGPILPGRYWLDGYGNAGYEGGPALWNLIQLAQAQGRRGGAWSNYSSATGAGVGGDDSGFLFYIDKDGSWTGN